MVHFFEEDRITKNKQSSRKKVVKWTIDQNGNEIYRSKGKILVGMGILIIN
jgi:hypothetical protein